MLQSPTVKGTTITELDPESIYIHINSGHDLCSGDGTETYKINLFKHANTNDFTD